MGNGEEAHVTDDQKKNEEKPLVSQAADGFVRVSQKVGDADLRKNRRS